jgi:hypothetical protein
MDKVKKIFKRGKNKSSSVIIKRTISDIDSGGIYFPEQVNKIGSDDYICNYSGLPSVMSYSEE